jgi:hypothetical protein
VAEGDGEGVRQTVPLRAKTCVVKPEPPEILETPPRLVDQPIDAGRGRPRIRGGPHLSGHELCHLSGRTQKGPDGLDVGRAAGGSGALVVRAAARDERGEHEDQTEGRARRHRRPIYR